MTAAVTAAQIRGFGVRGLAPKTGRPAPEQAARPAPEQAESPEQADQTAEIVPADILEESPAMVLELRVPSAIFTRVAELKATLPREGPVQPSHVRSVVLNDLPAGRVRRARRMASTLAAIVGACAGIALATTFSPRLDAPRPATAAQAKAASPMKTLANRPSSLETRVPTVAFESLPRALR